MNFITASTALLALLVKSCFLPGPLSAIEQSRAVDRLLQFVMLKSCFIGALFDPKTSNMVMYGSWILVQAIMVSFIGLAGDRSETLLSSPSTPTSKHVRCSLLMASIFALNVSWLRLATKFVSDPSWSSWTILWMIDAACVGVESLRCGLKYALQSLEQWWDLCGRRHEHCYHLGTFVYRNACCIVYDGFEQGEDVIQGLLYSVELCADLTIQMLRFAEAAHLLRARGGPKFQLADVVLLFDMRYLATGAWKRGQNHLQYRRLCHQVRYKFPDVRIDRAAKGSSTATVDDGVPLCGSRTIFGPRRDVLRGSRSGEQKDSLEGGTPADCTSRCHTSPQPDCAICLETMSVGKQLPCGHVFHLRCLARWMRAGQNQNTAFSCPLCRRSLLLSDDVNNGSCFEFGDESGDRLQPGDAYPVAEQGTLWNLRDMIFGHSIPGISLDRTYSTDLEEDWSCISNAPLPPSMAPENGSCSDGVERVGCIKSRENTRSCLFPNSESNKNPGVDSQVDNRHTPRVVGVIHRPVTRSMTRSNKA